MPKCKDNKIFDACGIAGFLNVDGHVENGSKIKQMMSILKDRENGLGGGYAVYGVWPKFQDQYCIQVLIDDPASHVRVDEYLKATVNIIKDEECLTSNNIQPAPIIWRYFVDVPEKIDNPDDIIVDIVMHINDKIEGAFCLSSGKNMVIFKGSGWAEDIAKFYQIERYKGYLWIGHSRFPTNTPGWWGGAHPFNILDYSVIHNGEITSYGTNKRYLEMWGYQCRLLTDTEVVAYLFDLLTRKHGLSLLMASNIVAPPYYDEITRISAKYQKIFKLFRVNYGSAMLNGPFSILVACNRPIPSLLGLTDRKKLRPLVIGMSDNEKTIYMSSEESAIKYVSSDVENIWAPNAGTAVIAQLKKGLISRGTERRLKSQQISQIIS
ncbi:MAG: glutamine amidotransferase family protein [Promethearchaeota archaeon]